MIGKMAYVPLKYLWYQIRDPMASNTMRHQEIDYSTIEVENQAIKCTDFKAVWPDDAPINFEI
jgi:hypothetical protein